MKITTIGLDIAKSIFHVVCCNQQGQLIKKKMLKRTQVLAYFYSTPSCLVAMESCATSHYWARAIRKSGHQVKLLPAQHVKAFLVGNKNDYNDAMAIVVAASQSHIRNVAVKSIEQQDNQALHKARDLVIKQRTALCNQIRGLLAEYGISLRKGINHLRQNLPLLLDEEDNQLSGIFKRLLNQLRNQLISLDKSIVLFGQLIVQAVKDNPICQRLLSIPGFGPMVSSAYFNEVGNGACYRKGRDVSASLGIVPKQYSSGGQNVLLGISKRGNKSLLCLLVQGAKAVVSRAWNKDDKLSQWINRIVETRGHNRACVAYANKMARMGWAVTVSGEEYSPA